MRDMASYNLRNTTTQSLMVGYYQGSREFYLAIVAGGTLEFEADRLFPETQVAIDRKWLVTVTGAPAPAPGFGAVQTGFALQWRNAWDVALRYDPGDVVTHGDYAWLCRASSAGLEPGTDESVWTIFSTPGIDDGVSGLAARTEALETALAALEHVPMDLTSFTVSPATAEVGATVTSVTFNWTRNKVPATLSINQGVGAVSPTLLAHTAAVSLTSTTAYTLTAGDGTAYSGATDTATASVSFQHRMYWGTSAATSLNSAGILGLANSAFATTRSRSLTLDGGGLYLYVAFPDSFGAPTFTVNGLVNSAWTKTVVSFTNASGNTTSYAVYRSDTVQNGLAIPIAVS